MHKQIRDAEEHREYVRGTSSSASQRDSKFWCATPYLISLMFLHLQRALKISCLSLKTAFKAEDPQNKVCIIIRGPLGCGGSICNLDMLFQKR